MGIVGEWLRRLGYLLRRGRHEEELRREIEAHRAMMAEPQAFGNALRLRDEARDAWGWTWLDDLVNDTRVSFRSLRRSPAFSLAAMATLALGIGVNAGMFSLVNAMLLRPQEASGVVEVDSDTTLPAGDEGRQFSYPNYRDLRDATTGVFEHLAAYTLVFLGVDAGDGPRRTMTAAVSANYFQAFGRPLALGRSFSPDEERPGSGSRVAVVSHRFWRQYGGDAGMLGRLVRINREPFTVIGVAPHGFTGASVPGPELWLPLGADDVFAAAGEDGRGLGARDTHALRIAGRLRAGETIDSAEPTVAAAAARLAAAYPEINAGYTFDFGTRNPFLMFPGSGGNRLATMIAALLMVMPGLVLLVACLNLADLLLARGAGRRQEIAIRASLGAGRGRLTRQLLTEGLLLALMAGTAGLFLSSWAANALVGSIQPMLTFGLSLPEPSVDWRVILATVVFSVAATLIFGAAPSWSLSGRAVVTDLKGRVADDGGRRGVLRMGNALVIGQVAISLALIACGGLFVMSAVSAASADAGFPLDRRLLVEVDPGLAGYDERRARDVLAALVDRVRSLPGVEAATLTSGLPFTGFGDSRDVAPAGSTDEFATVGARFMAVGRDHARTLGLPIRAGRDFREAELIPHAGEAVAIVDEQLARRLWGDENALGRLIQFRDGESEEEANRVMRVVGIVPAVNHSLGNPQPSAHVYVPLGQYYQSAMTLQIMLATGADDARMLSMVVSAIRTVDERVPVLRAETWRDHHHASLDVWILRTGARMFAAFGAIALVLAVVGVYGVKSYLVSRRTREFGIRIATGADPRTLLWQVLREGGRITAAGIGLGLMLAVGAGQLLQGFLYGVDAVEPVVLALAPFILLASSLLASYFPALRATKVDPMVALRSE